MRKANLVFPSFLTKLGAVVLLAIVGFSFSSYSASAQDDFYKFFTEFQNEVKSCKGHITCIDQHIEVCHNEGFQLSNFLNFYDALRKEYQTLCQLSSNNKYSVTKKNQKGGDVRWYIDNRDGVYGLHHKKGSGESARHFFCEFAKINGVWKITNTPCKKVE